MILCILRKIAVFLLQFLLEKGRRTQKHLLIFCRFAAKSSRNNMVVLQSPELKFSRNTIALYTIYHILHELLFRNWIVFFYGNPIRPVPLHLLRFCNLDRLIVPIQTDRIIGILLFLALFP